MLFYVLISLHGFVSLIYGNTGSQVMEQASSPGYYIFWMWLGFAGPLITIIGKSARGTFAYAGMWLELAGDIATWFIFVCYVGAIFDTDYWARGSFAGILATACLLGTPLFIMRDIRRLKQVEVKVLVDKRLEEVRRDNPPNG